MTKFDPNKKNPQLVWGTYIKNRKPEFKAYTQRNHAAAALKYHGKGTLYQFIDNQWVEIIEWTTPTHCDDCGNKYPYRHSAIYDPRKNFLDGGKAICYDCRKYYFVSYGWDGRGNIAPTKKWSDLYS